MCTLLSTQTAKFGGNSHLRVEAISATTKSRLPSLRTRSRLTLGTFALRWSERQVGSPLKYANEVLEIIVHPCTRPVLTNALFLRGPAHKFAIWAANVGRSGLPVERYGGRL
jgi:hypothetical protein